MDNNKLIIKKQLLPEIIDNTLPSIGNVLKSFGLPREVIASNDEIESVWRELPREISRIPNELRDGLIARMCVATSVGLFDGAINYIWNAVVLYLRARVKSFGLGYVSQTLNKKFEEDDLYDLTDCDLISLCRKLELLSEEGYFFLNQCRDIRNNFSSAHPSIAPIDDRELINFISRCCKYGINNDYILQGIHITDFIDTIKGNKLGNDAINSWVEKLQNTFPAQRTLLIPMLHGIYCDPSSNEHSRVNAITICIEIVELFDTKTNSALIDQHQSYISKGNEEKILASRVFFEKLGLIKILSNSEKHSIIKNACSSLMRVHQGFDNFYNEPPFAKNLCAITSSIQIPSTVQEEFVEVVVTCFVGNLYGVSRSAIPYYKKIIENFSPKEIEYLLNITKTNCIVHDRIKASSVCKNQYLNALDLIDITSLSPSQQTRYEKLKSLQQ